MDCPIFAVLDLKIHNHILCIKIITHHGCKSSSMVVYIDSVNCDLCLNLVELDLSRGGRDVIPAHGLTFSQPGNPGSGVVTSKEFSFFII